MDEEKGLIVKEYVRLATIRNTYEIVDRLRKYSSTLLNGEIMEVSDELVLGHDVLVRNISNTTNSLVAIPTTQIELTKDLCYAVLDKFEPFTFITTYYYTEVLTRENGKELSWRKCVTSSEKRRVQRMKKVVKVFGEMFIITP